MTSTLAQGVGRSPGKSARSLPVLAASPALFILLLVGLSLRLTIAYGLLPASGFETDLSSYASWALTLAEHGPGGFYASAGFSDYPPAYLYLLWPIGLLAQATPDAGATAMGLLKLPPILLDIAVGYLLYRLALGWTWPGRSAQRLALLAAALYVFNPVSIYDSAVWGQSDAAGALVLLLGVAALIRGNSEGAAAMAALAALVKPQFGVVLLPLVALVLLKRHLLRVGTGPRHAPWAPRALSAWLSERQGPVRLATSALAAAGLFFLVALPFGMGPLEYLTRMAETAGGYAWLTVNAFNAWALVGSGGDPSLAQSMTWASDSVPFVGPVPALAIGTALLAGGLLWGNVRAAVRDDRWTLLVAATFLAAAFFILPTRVHERYLFPVFAFLPLLAVVGRRWLVALLLLAGAAFINLHAILTTPLYGTDNVVALPLGAWFRSPAVVALAAVVVSVVGLWMAWQLRPALRTSPDGFDVAAADGKGAAADPRLRTAGPGGGPPLPAVGAAPPSRAAWLDSVVARLTRPPLRADRSAALLGERGGRIDGRDLLIAVGLVVLAVLIRGYRLDQPVAMYFDEVYHPRTATEFLQHWEYGEPHAIYEFTHPHLAKYAMAWGIRLAGDNVVHGSDALGVAVRDAAIERRWSTSPSSEGREGDRLFVATGEDVRAIDLASGAEEAVIRVAATTLAVDDDSPRLFLADADGSLFVLDTTVLDARRAGGAPEDDAPDAGLSPLSDGPGTPVEQLLVVGDTLISAGDGSISSFDPETGSLLAQRFAFDTADLAELPDSERLVVDPAQLADVDATATRLATLLTMPTDEEADDGADDAAAEDPDDAALDDPGLDAERAAEEERLRGLLEPGDRVVTDAYLPDDVRGRLRAAIDAAELPGVTLERGPLLAAADHDGIAVLDARTLDPITDVALDEPAEALVLVDAGLAEPTLYAATGERLEIVPIGEGGPGVTTSMAMPGRISALAWNDAANLVHALGEAPDGGSTVYVVEPHGNAVFADAPLPTAATHLLADTQPERPGDDRGELLAIGADGTIVRVGADGNAFGWRLPGMLLGALGAGLLYLLARVLFARRAVAVIAGVLVLVEGMLFANSRIGMNDVYVTTFLIAAALLFSPLYLAPRRPWTALLLLAGTGLALGLALASKWVALYAVGGLLLLVLFRSALGRVLALLGMLGLSAVLGAMAVRAASVDGANRNWLFVAIMLLLTALLAAAMVRRPLPFTRGEVWLAVLGPIVAGVALIAAGLLWQPGAADAADAADAAAAGSALVTPVRLLVAGVAGVVVGLVLGVVTRLATRDGHGPFAAHRRGVTADPPRTTSSWLHPGRLGGLPWLATLACLGLVPIVVYVMSYAPWIELGNRWGLPLVGSLPFMPEGADGGRTLADLTRSMYDYHNDLRATHAASSPWWAWPLDLKPVWWFSDTYADGTAGYIYDAGSLVVFWLGIAGLAFAAWAAWTRRSLSLTVVVILWAVLWLPWARIDRATFQYHVYASLPFVVLSLAYLLAELWHGPSARVWLLARVAAVLAILGAPLLWLLRGPLCVLGRVAAVRAESAACSAEVTRTGYVSEAALAALGVLAVGAAAAGLLGWWSVRVARSGSARRGDADRRGIVTGINVALAAVAVLTAVGVVAALSLLDTASPTAVVVTSDVLALIGLAILALPAVLVLRARDARRFVLGVLGAAVLWFVLWYPNLAALPMPSAIASLYQGLLPTWNWDFQFAVNTDPAVDGALIDAGTLVIGGTALLLVIGVALAARWWGRPESEEVSSAGPWVPQR